MVPLNGRHWPALFAAAPGMALTAWLSMALLGAGPVLDPVEPLTLPEAVAIGAPAEAIRLMRRGTDPNRPAAVRVSIFERNVGELTPLEAAAAARRADMLALLVDRGAVLHDGNYPSVWCLAQMGREPGVITFVESHRPATTPVAPHDCSRVRALW